MLPADSSYPNVHACCPLPESPNPMHPRQMRDTSMPVDPNAAYFMCGPHPLRRVDSGQAYALPHLITKTYIAYITMRNLHGIGKGGGPTPMDIRTMRSFIAIVQTGSITRAAEELHISQPALSRQVIELERGDRRPWTYAPCARS